MKAGFGSVRFQKVSVYVFGSITDNCIGYIIKYIFKKLN